MSCKRNSIFFHYYKYLSALFQFISIGWGRDKFLYTCAAAKGKNNRKCRFVLLLHTQTEWKRCFPDHDSVCCSWQLSYNFKENNIMCNILRNCFCCNNRCNDRCDDRCDCNDNCGGGFGGCWWIIILIFIVCCCN